MEEKAVKITAGFNLLNPTRRPLSLAEKIYTWALSIGRYIIIGTEVVVLVAFAARFKLDYDISDLTENIEKKAQQIAAYKTKEDKYREIINKIDTYKSLLSSRRLMVSRELTHIESLKPADVSIDSLSFTEKDITIEGHAESLASLSSLENSLKRETAVYHSQHPDENAPVRYKNVLVEKAESGSHLEKNRFSLKIILLETEEIEEKG